MPEQITPTEPNFKTPPAALIEHPEKSFLMRHIVAEVLGVAFVIALGSVGYYWQTTRIETPVFEPIKHEDSTANWKTYTNTELGIEFKYFKDLIVSDFINKDFKGVYIEFPSGSIANYSESSFYDVYVNLKEKYGGVKTLIEVNGKTYEKWRQDIYAVEAYTVVFTPYKALSFQNIGKTPSDLEIFDQILSTFKFTEPVTQINSFASCAAAGHPIMESYPEKCSTPDGVTFVKPIGACIQVIQSAKNLKTGEIRDFPTPCDVPEGWVKVTPEGSS
jgi:hypothetical protein